MVAANGREYGSWQWEGVWELPKGVGGGTGAGKGSGVSELVMGGGMGAGKGGIWELAMGGGMGAANGRGYGSLQREGVWELLVWELAMGRKGHGSC